VGRLLGLETDRQVHAFGLAGSQSAGTFAAWGTPTVKFHQSRGAVSGLLAGLLAQQGFRASDDILCHPDGGLFSTYSDGGRPELVTQGLGNTWELENISLRLWPAASSIQSVITAMFALIEAHDLRPERIERVRVGLSEPVHAMHGTIGWKDFRKFTALLSAQYVVAVVLADRRCWLEQFESERTEDPAVIEFARQRVEVEVDPSVEGTAAVVEVRTIDGATYVDRRSVPRGDAADPLGRAEIEAKLRMASERSFSAAAAERVLELIGGLEDMPRIRELCQVLRAPVAAYA
jgi:2-methylcitrate dehydratase PrpD